MSVSLSLKVFTILLVCSVILDLAFSPRTNFDERKSHHASIAKMVMLYGEPNPLMERVLDTHRVHNEKFGYAFYVLRKQILPKYWSKPAYLLRLLLTELEKPEEQRLQWLVWMDADVAIMNPNIPLDIFLPPPDKWSHIHALMTNDKHGLNNGVFFLRVNEWSAWLMNACLNTPLHAPELDLRFGDQTALEYWLFKEEFRNHTMHMPQRWFNAYPGSRGGPAGIFPDPLERTDQYQVNSVIEGDLLVHFAGSRAVRAQRMLPWIKVAEQHLPSWELPLNATNYRQEISEFWDQLAEDEWIYMDEVQQLVEQQMQLRQQTKKEQESPALDMI